MNRIVTDQVVESSRVKAVPVLEVKNLTKEYGKNKALNNVSLGFFPGAVHVLFGENGAGKSTLISMLAGANEPTDGVIKVNGDSLSRFESVAHARKFGVRAVFQEFSLVPHRTVAENVMLGEEPLGGLRFLNKSVARDEAKKLIDDLGFDLDVDAKLGSLTRGKQQMVEICKALRHPPRLLILDEPTASLSEHDAQALISLVHRLKDRGTAIIYVTHRMHEIREVGDHVSVLRDGELISTVPSATPEDQLIHLMTGRTVSKSYPSVPFG